VALRSNKRSGSACSNCLPSMYVVISFAVSENVSTVPIVMTGSFSACFCCLFILYALLLEYDRT